MKRRPTDPSNDGTAGEQYQHPGLTSERILEFQRLIEKCHGVSLGYEEASERAAKLVALYRAVLGPIPETFSESRAP